MCQYFLQIYYLFILCVFIQVKYEISQEHALEKAPETELRPKCTENYCTCDEIPRWNGVQCIQRFWAKFPTLYFRNYKYLPLHVKRLTYLPGRMFLGFPINAINLLEFDIDVADNVLEGILSLYEFNVGGSSIQAVPDFRFANNSIKMITIFSSLLTSLEGKNLQNLTKLSTLSFFNNSIQYIDPDVLKGTENIGSLLFDYNLLTYIPPNLLDPLKNLSLFSVKHNRLLHVDDLFHITRPREIFLQFNNITNFSLTHIFNLEKIQSFTELDYLDLEHNFIKDTSSPVSTCNRNLDAMLKMRRLNLNGNKILNLNNCLRCSQLKILEIIENQIEILTETDFISVFNTEELLLRENQIHQIDTDTFKPFNTSLLVLNLKSNKMTSINGSVKYLSGLRRLFLSYNSIQTIAEDEFTGLHALLELSLENNQIKSLGMTLQILEKLEVLNITQNDIKLMKSDQLPSTLKSFYSVDIPLKCYCKNLPLLNTVKHDKENGICLRSELENHLQKHLNCLDMCTCKCTEIGDSFAMFVDCSSRNLSFVPHFMENNLPQFEVDEMFSSDDGRYRVMYQNIDHSKHFEGNVLGISLENNKLDILDAAQLPPNLVQLYLSNNKLRRFPQSVMDSQTNLKQVSLSGNPWKCDCDALDFKKWLASNSHIITDFDNVRCGISDKGVKNLNESVIWTINDADLCPPTNFVLIFSVSSLSFVIFCLFAKVLYTTYELNIKVSLYSHGFTFVKEKVLDQDKAFDVFISFSDEDSELVITEIIPEIENRDPNIRLCLQYRHFRPGVPIVDNIKHAVQKSRLTLLIISRNFLESEWCMFEFQTALRESLQDNVHRIIAVKIGKLPREIDPTMKVYLDSTTYLIWGEDNFWNKLLYILPSRSSDAGPFLRFVGDKETVFNLSSSDL